jgi:hypothetical protein
MAVINSDQVTQIKILSGEPQIRAYLLKGVNTNDTFDCGVTFPDFASVENVRAIHLTGTIRGTITTPTISTTNLTIAAATVVNDSVLLVVSGASHK